MEVKSSFPSRKDRKKHKGKSGWFSFLGGREKNQVENSENAAQQEEKFIAAKLPAPAPSDAGQEVAGTSKNTPHFVSIEQEISRENFPPPSKREIRVAVANFLNNSFANGEKNKLGDNSYTLQKKRKKLIRSIFQFIIISFILYGFATLFLTIHNYQPYNTQANDFSSDKGFIAISYIGTQRVTAHNLFGLSLLRQHLKALKDLGYVTITQQDITEYYQSGKRLPEKALFLMFEDARRNTVIFSQKVLEELNFKATMLTYPERFLLNDPRFLKPGEIAALEKTSFWELGSNGYRYAFINVFDRYENYFPQMNLFEHTGVAPYLDLHLPKKRQNHYLMDYIRDRHGTPTETYDDMRARINRDYEAMYDIYTNQVGSMPGLYVLMHPNTGKFGDNDDVSAINEYWIKKLFKINFNRTGFCVNKPGDNIYNLTRMQPQAWWSVNHLLVWLRHDLRQDLDFVTGDADKLKKWDILKGAAEFQTKTIILTSFPREVGLLKLKDSGEFKDVYVSVAFKGNMLGLQKIYLRADESLGRFLSVYIMDNYLYVTEKNGGDEILLFKLDLDQHDEKMPRSVPEDKKMAELSELEAFMKYVPSKEQAQVYAGQIKAKKMEVVAGVADGAPEYLPIITADAKGNRKLLISLKGERLSISIDGKTAANNLLVANTQAGLFCLEAGWSGKFWADKVYDGVFDDLLITENTGIKNTDEAVLFDIKPQGMEAVKFKAALIWGNIVEFFISKI